MLLEQNKITTTTKTMPRAGAWYSTSCSEALKKPEKSENSSKIRPSQRGKNHQDVAEYVRRMNRLVGNFG